MDYHVLLLVRLVHIVSSVFWVGGVLLLAGFVFPSVRALGPIGGPVMQQLAQVRRLPSWLMSATILGLLSGFGLYWHDAAGFTSGWAGSRQGIAFGLGGVLALSAAVLGMAVNTPVAKRMASIMGGVQAAGRAPTPDELADVRRLQGRLSAALALGAGLLLLATAVMAVARYVQ